MRGQTATWQNQREGEPSPLSAARPRVTAFGSWWTSVPRAQWRSAVHARWRGPAPEAPMQSIARLALVRRRVPPSKRKPRRGR